MSQNPIYAGRCLVHTESLIANPPKHYTPSAGVRISQPSSGGGDEQYTPPSDVYLFMSVKDAQELSAYFSKIARTLQGIEA